MRLIGSDTKFRLTKGAVTVGAYFNEVTLNIDSEIVDVSTANSAVGQQRVDTSSATATITASGFVDHASNTSFIDLGAVGDIVDISCFTKIGASTTSNTLLNKYAPWQISKFSLKHGKRTATEDTIELVGTGGSVDANTLASLPFPC